MSDTKTPETKTETKDQTAAPAAPALPKVGDVIRLRAVHGYMQHPFDLTEFDAGREPKVVFDNWHLVQVEAGKLAVVTE